jgi:molecular chaperone DnaK
MRKDAESHADDDKTKLEEIQTRNEADNAVYRTEKLIKDNADKISADDKGKLEAAIGAVKEALKGTDFAAIKTANEKLNEVAQTVGAELYKAAAAKGQANPGQAGGQPQGEGEAPKSDDKKKDDGVIDAEVVDEKK